MKADVDLAIVGGGAAGLATAIFAAETRSDLRIAILDGAPKLGTKILVSGGGRCNVTHRSASPKDFNGPAPVIRGVLKAFGIKATRQWFDSMGVQLVEEPTGKLFPSTSRAATVRDALVKRCMDLGVQLRTKHRVQSIRQANELFVVDHERGNTSAQKLVLATGGRSLPKTGSDGSGWRIVRELGHQVTDTFQALVPLCIGPAFFHTRLSGISADFTLTTTAEGKRVDQRRGSLLLTHFGASGPVVMDASRHFLATRRETANTKLLAALDPRSFDAVDNDLVRISQENPRQNIVAAVRTILDSSEPPARLLNELISFAGIQPKPSGQLKREERRTLCHALTNLEIPVTESRGWNYAEVTAGGVPLTEVERGTFESRLVPGLFLVGEILDCDGRIGGFNFQWAWSTGHIAGCAAASQI